MKNLRFLSPRMARLAALLFVYLATASLARSQDRVFVTIDPPGAVSAKAFGVSPNGHVVGVYITSDNRSHGFLKTEDGFITIDYPGAGFTDARSINAKGEIVGNYRMPWEVPPAIHGYLRTTTGDFIPLDYPGHNNVIVQRNTSTGVVVGCYHDLDTVGTMHGFRLSASVYSSMEAQASMINGATPSGRTLVGTVYDMVKGASFARGFVLRKSTEAESDKNVPPDAQEPDFGDLFFFDAPGATFTEAWDVNPETEIVGTTQDAVHVFHGFVSRDGKFSLVDYPGAIETRAFGINAEGTVVGGYVGGGETTGSCTLGLKAKVMPCHAFLATRND